MRPVDSIPYNQPLDDDYKKATCGPLFQKCLSYFTSHYSSDLILLFAAGMALGQAEKIYLGACQAAMFRPSKENHGKMLAVCVYLSGIYRLEVSVFNRPEIWNEVWLHTNKCGHLLYNTLQNEDVNSPIWHTVRGMLCGIPYNQIDLDFHLRRGYREDCDNIRTTGK